VQLRKARDAGLTLDVDEQIGTAMVARLGLASSTNAMMNLPMLVAAVKELWVQQTSLVHLVANSMAWLQRVFEANHWDLESVGAAPDLGGSFTPPWLVEEEAAGEEEGEEEEGEEEEEASSGDDSD
jgi:hypothetical protein